MDIKDFRYLFENTEDGIVHSGCVGGDGERQETNFVYACGVQNPGMPGEHVRFRFQKTMEPCHIFVLASFSSRYIRILLEMVRLRRVKTVLLPYVSPIGRLLLFQSQKEEMRNPEYMNFMAHPYSFLRQAGVEQVYLICGNGAPLMGEQQDMEPGHYFEPAEPKELHRIRELEGRYVPAVKAGYIIASGWLFYFGHYGEDLSCGGSSPGELLSSTLAMFQGPLHTDGGTMDSVMTGKPFGRAKQCLPYFKRNTGNCLMSCLYKEDYAIYRKHKEAGASSGCFGTLSLGNANLNRYFNEIKERFKSVLLQIRAVTVPGSGNREFWNRHCLSFALGEGMKYWICGLDRRTSKEVIADMVVSSPLNRIVVISEEFGYCFSGYLVPCAEEFP